MSIWIILKNLVWTYKECKFIDIEPLDCSCTLHLIWLLFREVMGIWVFYFSSWIPFNWLPFEIWLKSLHVVQSTFETCKMESNGWLVRMLLGVIEKTFGFVVLAFAKVTSKGAMILVIFSIFLLSFSRIAFNNLQMSFWVLSIPFYNY